jgi:hypothetical protein
MKQSDTSRIINKINTKLGYIKINGAYYKDYQTYLFFENLKAKGEKNKSFWVL